jgi:hypothetical protein
VSYKWIIDPNVTHFTLFLKSEKDLQGIYTCNLYVLYFVSEIYDILLLIMNVMNFELLLCIYII